MDIVMKSTTIWVWGCQDILSSSIELICGAQAGWQVIHPSTAQPLDIWLPAAAATPPDVVILIGDASDHLADLALQFVSGHPATTVLSISSEENMLQIYRAQTVIIERASDLITAIQTELQARQPLRYRD